MDSELNNFVKIWIIAIFSLCYSHSVTSRIPRGILRLFSLLPIFSLFITLPLNLYSHHLGSPTTFYLVWLANFKLLLFAFHNGPLFSNPPLPLLHFISIALLPIKPKQSPNYPLSKKVNSPDPSPKHPLPKNGEKLSKNGGKVNPPPTDPSPKHPLPKNGEKLSKNGGKVNPPPDSSPKHPFYKKVNDQDQSPKDPIFTHGDKVNGSDPSTERPPSKYGKKVLLAFKIVLLAVIVHLYNYRPYLHTYFILALYCCHLYLGVELMLALTALPVRAIFGFELEPQFNEPYLATSLQDFWGRRWNLMVSSILRPTVYFPVLVAGKHALGQKWARPFAFFATFLVSGLMHEVIYFYMTRVGPTWEVTGFYVLQGVCTAAEVAVKKAVAGRWRLHVAVSGVLTLGFVAVTGYWLFFPQIINNGVDLKAINEYSIFSSFVKQKIRNMLSMISSAKIN